MNLLCFRFNISTAIIYQLIMAIWTWNLSRVLHVKQDLAISRIFCDHPWLFWGEDCFAQFLVNFIDCVFILLFVSCWFLYDFPSSCFCVSYYDTLVCINSSLVQLLHLKPYYFISLWLNILQYIAAGFFL